MVVGRIRLEWDIMEGEAEFTMKIKDNVMLEFKIS